MSEEAFYKSQAEMLQKRNKELFQALVSVIHAQGDRVEVRPSLGFNPSEQILKTYFDASTMVQIYEVENIWKTKQSDEIIMM